MVETSRKREMVNDEDERPLPFHLMPQLTKAKTPTQKVVPVAAIPVAAVLPAEEQERMPQQFLHSSPTQNAQHVPMEGVPSTHTLVIDLNQVNGRLLRSFREGRQLSIDTISARTKVPKKYLLAIEADDFANMPAPIYFRGFVTAYLREIGLSNHKQIIDVLSQNYLQRVRR